MDPRKKQKEIKNQDCLFYSETFSIQITKSQEQVKEAVVIEGFNEKSPSIFLVFHDNKFYHVSLKTKEILNVGEFKTSDTCNFKVVRLRNKTYLGYTSQYKLHLLDLAENQLLQNHLPIKIPGYHEVKLTDEQKQTLMQDGFMYDGFNEQNVLATCEVVGVTALPSEDKNLFYCCIYNLNVNDFQYIFHIDTKSKQVVFCKLNDSNTFAVFENHRQFSKSDKAEAIMHTYNITKNKIEGYRKLKFPIKNDSCVLHARYIGKDDSQIVLVGNDQCAPFIKIYTITPQKEPKITLVTDLLLTRPFDQVMSKVLASDDQCIFYEMIQEDGTYIECLKFENRQILFRKKIQYLKNSLNSNDYNDMNEDEQNELQKYSCDQSYVASLSTFGNKIIVFLDDKDYENYYGQKPYSLIINFQRYTTQYTLYFYLMTQKLLLSDYSEYDLKCCIDMLIKEEGDDHQKKKHQFSMKNSHH